MISVSIIIPVYNVKKYLEICVASVTKYTGSNIEIILIDDGSTDGSGNLCDQLAEQDSRIKIIHKSNGGLSDARNRGMEIASGRYYFFLDSDDYILKTDNFVKLICFLEKYDPEAVIINSCKIYEKNKSKHSRLGKEKDVFDTLSVKEAVEKGYYHACAWNKIIRSDFIKKNKIQFPLHKLSEDMEYCGKLLQSLKQVVVYYAPVYAYRQREGSISKTISRRHLEDIYSMITDGIDGQKNILIKSYFSYEYVVLLGNSKNADKELCSKIYQLENLLEYGEQRKVVLVKKLKKVLGIKLIRRLLIMFVSVKQRSMR